MNILDVGCGFRAWHIKRGTIGIDLYKGLADVVADAHYLPFRNSAFEGCVCTLLEHVIDPLRVLEEMHYVLKAGGWLKIQVPIQSKLRADPLVRILNVDLKGILLQFKKRPQPEAHKWQFSEASLRRKLTEKKFQVTKVEYPPIPVIYRRIGKTLTRGFVRHPALLVLAKKGD